MKKMLLVMVMAVCAATAPAANLLWVASGVDSNWTTANNFIEIGTLNYPLPAPGDLVLIGHPTVSSWGPPWPVLTSSAQIGMLGLGWWGNCLGTPELTIGTGGALVVTDFTRMSLDAGGGNNTTIINVNGGTLTTSVLEMGYTSGSNSTISIDGGFVHAGVLTFGPGTAKINIAQGNYLFLSGDKTTDVAQWIQQGKIAGKAGKSLEWDYNQTIPGLTAVYVVPEPTTIALLGLGVMSLVRKRKWLHL